jgi:hypothetical protein
MNSVNFQERATAENGLWLNKEGERMDRKSCITTVVPLVFFLLQLNF